MESEVNVIEIIEEIRADITAKGYTDDAPSFNNTMRSFEQEDSDFDLHILEANLAEYGVSHTINTHPVIASNNGLFGRLAIFVKRIIRKCINFHVTPIVWDVNQLNYRALEMFRQLRNAAKIQNEFDYRLARLELDLNRTNQRLDEENKKLKYLLDKNGVRRS